jgi:hypothetical protein
MSMTAQDVVGVFDSGFNQLFEEARTMKASVKETAKGMKSPIETGSTVTDHIVFNPDVIDLYVVVQAGAVQDTYQEIKSLYKSATLMSVQTNTDTYDNMYITEMPHDETPEMFDAVGITIKFEEADFVAAQFGQLTVKQVKKPSDASTTQAGEKTAAPVDNGTTLQQVFNGIFGSNQ